MGIFSPAGSSSISLVGATAPNISNTPLAVAGTEYTISLPTGTKKFQIQLRGVATLQLALTAGASGTTFWTLHAGAAWTEDGLTVQSPIDLYVQATQNTQVLELLYWL